MKNWLGMLIATALIGLLYTASEIQAAITIPNTIDVDTLGGEALTAAAPGVVSVVGVSVVLLLIGVAIWAVKRGVRKLH